MSVLLVCIHVCVPHACQMPKKIRRQCLIPLEVELQVIMSQRVGVGTQTSVFPKIDKCFFLQLSHDTSPILHRTVRLHLKACSRKERKSPLKNLENLFSFLPSLLPFLPPFLSHFLFFFFHGCFIYLFSFHFKSDSQLVKFLNIRTPDFSPSCPLPLSDTPL